MEERDGLVTREDLAAYRVEWLDARRGDVRGRARPDPRRALASSSTRWRPSRRSAARPGRSGARPRADPRRAALQRADRTSTRRISCAVDPAGNACVVTTSLGLGSGDFLPGFDVHLNSMLGESDLLIGPLEAGKRMESMMSPTVGARRRRARARRRRRRGHAPAACPRAGALGHPGRGARARRTAVDRPRLHSTGETSSTRARLRRTRRSTRSLETGIRRAALGRAPPLLRRRQRGRTGAGAPPPTRTHGSGARALAPGLGRAAAAAARRPRRPRRSGRRGPARSRTRAPRAAAPRARGAGACRTDRPRSRAGRPRSGARCLRSVG